MTQFEQEVIEKLSTLSTQQGNTTAYIADLAHVLRGNGRPGIIDRLTCVENSVQAVAKSQLECPARENATNQARRHRKELTAAVISTSAAVATAIVAIIAIVLK